LKSSTKDHPQLVREIHHHRQFNHPHIARLYEIIITPNYVWLVLEYCAGDELYTYLIKNGRLKRDEARKMFAQLCGAVAYTHSKNCTHRDLKLENILLDRHNNVKLCDFGFTREYEPRTLLDTVCGTTCYMAPEMLLHKKYSGESVDVWSLGIILYTLIYGEMPFEEDTELDSKLKITTEEPNYPDLDVPTSALSLMKAMLTKDPRQRPTLHEVLSHPFLEEHGQKQKDILSEKSPKLFSTKAEKKVLRHLRSAHVDLEALADSIVTAKCDPLAGFWALALEREKRIESKRSHRTSISISKRYSRSSKQPREKQSLRINANEANAATASGRDSSEVQQSPKSPFSRFASPLARSSGEHRHSSNMESDNEAKQPQTTEAETQQHSSPPVVETIPPTPPPNGAHNNTNSESQTEYSPSAKSSMSTVLSKTKKTFTSSSTETKKGTNSFKNIMLKILFPGGRKKYSTRRSSDFTAGETNDSSATGVEDDLNRRNTIQIPEPKQLEEKQVGSRPDDMHKVGKQRPVSEISQFSQVSQYSQLSIASQISSAPSQLSQGQSSITRRPEYNRRSTSSSFSSLVSRSRREHSKTSSTSSASLNSSPRGSRRLSSPGSPVPAFSVGRHRRHVSGPRGRFNEAAVFSSSPYRTRHFKRRLQSSSRPTSLTRNKNRGSKGSVIEEGDEDELEEDIGYDDETEDDHDRGRTF
jgi:serine/threonine protein kinase